MIRISRGTAALLAALDLLTVVAAFAAAYVLRFRWGLLAVVEVEAPSVVDYAKALAAVLVVFFLVFRARGLYRDVLPRGIDVIEESFNALNVSVVIVLAASFFYREITYSRSVCLLAWGLMCVGLPIPRLLQLGARRRAYARGEGLIPAVVVGSTPAALELAERLDAPIRYGLDVKGVLATPGGEAPPAGVTVLGDLADLESVVASSGVREVLIPDTLERLQLFDVLEVCGRAGVEPRIVPRIYDLFVRAGDLTQLYGVPFVAAREQRGELLSLAAKRLFDLALGGALLLVASPLIAVLAFLVRRESPGAALFVQRRVGQDGRPFDMWKLRSMVQDAEARLSDLVDLDTLDEPVYKLEDDPRVTPIGRFIRRWSLDELPQLWNVVLGNMSLVGPRPEVADVVERYDAHQRRRLKAKPGLTGLQQVEARAAPSLNDRIALDVYYIRRRSFLFDLHLLLRTPWAVLSGRGAT